MAKGRQRDPQRETYWRRMVERQCRSGLSVREFCSRAGVTESACRAWQRIIEQRDRERQPLRNDAASPAPAFLPVVVADANDAHAGALGAPITIELRGGRTMRLPASMSTAQLTAVLRAVEEAA